MVKFNENMTMVDRIDSLARWIMVNSIIYYELNNNIVTDRMYDDNSKVLAVLIKEHPQYSKQCYYWYVIHDFDGNTGFDLKDRLTEFDKTHLYNIALNVTKSYRGSY